MLGHDVLDGVYAVIKMRIHIFCLDRSVVLQPLEQICLILTAHLVNSFCFQGLGKLRIIREPTAFLLGKKRIDKLIDIVVRGIVVPVNFLIQIQEDLI